ncbi:MAG TPA: FAD binding domain-containing protein [Dermatophilaceae bacterium]|nr:FAD binding domain-containing protein [Dermatophilaceae bacterium]
MAGTGGHGPGLASCLVNDRPQPVRADPEEVLLDVLRHREHLTGAKDGCHEGDCGACTVLVGEASAGGVRYVAVCSCLVPFADVHGRHVVTVEGLRLADGATCVQRALGEEGGVQCGFCTPGVVLALTGHLLDPRAPGQLGAALAAVEGNLCRCTGHVGIVRAVRRLVAEAPTTGPADAPPDHHGAPTDPGGTPADRPAALDVPALRRLAERGVVPPYLTQVPARLHALTGTMGPLTMPAPGPGTRVVAGGTDAHADPGPPTLADPGPPTLGGGGPARHAGAVLHLGATTRPGDERVTRGDLGVLVIPATTVEALRQDPVARAEWPGLTEALELFGSAQIRHRATVGGNLAGGSPVADLACLLAVVGATVRLTGPAGQRELALPDFWTGHRATDLRPGELVDAVLLARAEPGRRLVFERASRRRHLDIATASVAVAAHVAGPVLSSVAVAAGGVGPTVRVLRAVAARLEGRPLDPDLLAAVLALAPTEVAPIDDVRGSAAYRRLLVRQLLAAALDEMVPGVLTPELLP